MLKKIFLSILLLITSLLIKGQYIKHNYIRYSLGYIKTELIDEYDNSIIYQASKFQPFSIGTCFAGENWRHLINFYYLEYKLHPIVDNFHEYNSIAKKSGEFNYDILRKINLSDSSKFRLFAGIGVHSFGTRRERKSFSDLYPYESKVYSYDINLMSFQIVIYPELKLNNQVVFLYISTGILNELLRPNSYNPRFDTDSNEVESVTASFSKHFNINSTLGYTFRISNRLDMNLSYTYFFYKYSFPYPLKILNQRYLTGLSFKF